MNNIDNTDYKSLLSFIMHDLREINIMIKESARLISVACKGTKLDEECLRHHAGEIVEQASVLSSWLAIVDMHIDPGRFEKEPKRRISLHELFFGARATFARVIKKKHFRVSLIGNGKFYIEAHPVMDIMPYVLFDNAVKYSPVYGTIEVELEDRGSQQRVIFSSVGPHVKSDEIEQLCTTGYRGFYAQKMTQVGTGQGLALLRRICMVHDAYLHISSSDKTIEINDIPYSDFRVEMLFKSA